jgi:hypothetical protein
MTVRPPTAFDAPQFALVPDSTRRLYANVDNLLELRAGETVLCALPVAVPTALFAIMREVLKVPREAEAFLYLEQCGDLFIFGVAWGSADFTDLWVYSEASLPGMFRLARKPDDP